MKKFLLFPYRLLNAIAGTIFWLIIARGMSRGVSYKDSSSKK